MRTLTLIILSSLFLTLSCGPGDSGSSVTCGDGIREGDETCDDGNLIDGDGCSSTCIFESNAECGNGNVETGEQCDDGNVLPGDGCSATCQVETGPICGNGITEAGEGCDDGNTTPGDGCDEFCRSEYCQNGIQEGDEECDDGNSTNGDGCDEQCRIEECGNDRIDEGEECDGVVPEEISCETLGGYGGHVSCNADCTYDTSTCGFCGDGVTDYPQEECDDGNTADLDGCNNDCTGTSSYCLTDGSLGSFGVGSSTSFTADTQGGWYVVNPTCGGSPGAERVYSITITEDLDLQVSVTSSTTPHAVAMYGAGAPDAGLCTSGAVIGCAQLAAGENQTWHVPAGDYVIVVDSMDATAPGVVALDLSFNAWTVLLDEGFESCSLPSGWTMNGGIWEVGSATGTEPAACATGSCCVGTDFGVDYPSSMAWDSHCLTTSSYTIPVNATLTFASWLSTETSFDGGIFEVNDGSGWADTPTGSRNPDYHQDNGGRMTWAGSYASWSTYTVDLSSYAGQSVQMRWCFYSDGSITYPGWFIDDIYLD